MAYIFKYLKCRWMSFFSQRLLSIIQISIIHIRVLFEKPLTFNCFCLSILCRNSSKIHMMTVCVTHLSFKIWVITFFNRQQASNTWRVPSTSLKARWNTCGTLWSAREIAAVALSAEQERHTRCVSRCLNVVRCNYHWKLLDKIFIPVWQKSASSNSSSREYAVK